MSGTTARVTVVLRDIPADVSEQEIRQLFAGDNVVRVKPDIGNTWFVTFGTEDDCLAAYEKCQLKCLRDEPLKARIKSENVVSRYASEYAADSPSFAPSIPPAASPAGFPPGAPMPPYPQMVPGGYPAAPFPYAAGRPYPGFMLGPSGPPHGPVALAAAGGPGWWDHGKGKGARRDAEKQPAPGPEEPLRRFRKEEIIGILTELMNTEAGKARPALPDLWCVVPQQLAGLELCRDGDVHRIVEAAVSASDVKVADRTTSRGSGRRAHPVALVS